MLTGPLTHPELIGALAAAGHGSTVLLAAGCADSRANAPSPRHHLRPSSNQNPDTDAH